MSLNNGPADKSKYFDTSFEWHLSKISGYSKHSYASKQWFFLNWHIDENTIQMC